MTPHWLPSLSMGGESCKTEPCTVQGHIYFVRESVCMCVVEIHLGKKTTLFMGHDLLCEILLLSKALHFFGEVNCFGLEPISAAEIFTAPKSKGCKISALHNLYRYISNQHLIECKAQSFLFLIPVIFQWSCQSAY